LSNFEERTLDWRSRHDSRSKDYPIRSIINQKDIEVKSVFWKEGTILDQGREGACVGFAWTGELLTEPVAPKQQPSEELGNSLALSYYKRAQKIDQWPGEDYEGTSVLAGAKIMQQEGFIDSYRWCFGVRDVRDTLLTVGPVVIGVPWHSGMYSTGRGGLVRVTGSNVGGHALVLTGYDPNFRATPGGRTYEVFRWRNSWGSDYGVDGSGYIKYNDLEKLLKQTGEACVPLGRKTPDFNQPWSRFQHLFLNRLFG
jgi:hypothetical protein